MQALKDGARTYRADWAVNRENRDDFDGLYGIIIGIDSADKYSTSKAYIWIEYEFLNYDAAQEALNDVLYCFVKKTAMYAYEGTAASFMTYSVFMGQLFILAQRMTLFSLA